MWGIAKITPRYRLKRHFIKMQMEKSHHLDRSSFSFPLAPRTGLFIQESAPKESLGCILIMDCCSWLQDRNWTSMLLFSQTEPLMITYTSSEGHSLQKIIFGLLECALDPSITIFWCIPRAITKDNGVLTSGELIFIPSLIQASIKYWKMAYSLAFT